MNRGAFNRPPGNPNSGCADLVATAERELSAFFNAVKEVFGPEQAERSVEDWLHELNESEGLPASTRQWRLITTKASTRLARRMNALSWSIELRSA